MSALERNIFINNEKDPTGVLFNQPAIFEASAQPTPTSIDVQAKPVRRISVINTLNKRPSIAGQCPFSGHLIGVETSAT